MGEPNQNFGHGNQAAYVLGSDEGWGAFGVVRWHAVEEISHPFRYEITLQRDAKDGPVDLNAMFNAAATFRIRTLGHVRPIHGIIAEAEEIDRAPLAIFYRVLLVPPFYRARFRRRCRNFVDTKLKDIVIAVLENRSPAFPKGNKGLRAESGSPTPLDDEPSFDDFTAPDELYRWAVADEARVTDATTSPYIVQYNESDFDFLSRLLEREGLSYFFEHTNDASVMVITDNPIKDAIFDEAKQITLHSTRSGGQSAGLEVIRACRSGRRMRSRAVIMRDYDWNRSLSGFEAEWDEKESDPDAEGHFEWPAGDELNKKDPGAFPAQIRLERFSAESSLRDGVGTARAIEPGRKFKLHDDAGQRDDQELLTVRVEVFATELTPEGTVLDDEPFGFAGDTGPLVSGYENHFQALPAKTQFRPAMSAPRPRIHGVQTAMVNAEEFPAGGRPEINADAYGCVRVRFPWDQRPEDDKTPSSNWIRVSQYWAGPGFGALYNPRVGHEVLVAYLQGDPERPVVVGRVYNEPNRPPYDPTRYPTRSTLKSQTAAPQSDGFNEFRFEDASSLEEIFLHAQRDLNEVVRASHSTSVGGNQSNSVGGDQSNTVKQNRTHEVLGTESVTVHGDRTTLFESNEGHTVYSARLTTIGTTDTTVIFADRSTEVGATDSLKIKTKREVVIGTDEDVTIGANQNNRANGHFSWKAMNGFFTLSNDFNVSTTTAEFYPRASFLVNVMGCALTMTPGEISLAVGGASIVMKGGHIAINNGAGSILDLTGGAITIIAGGSVFSRSSGTTTVSAGGDMFLVGANINAHGGVIKLND